MDNFNPQEKAIPKSPANEKLKFFYNHNTVFKNVKKSKYNKGITLGEQALNSLISKHSEVNKILSKLKEYDSNNSGTVDSVNQGNPGGKTKRVKKSGVLNSNRGRIRLKRYKTYCAELESERNRSKRMPNIANVNIHININNSKTKTSSNLNSKVEDMIIPQTPEISGSNGKEYLTYL